MKRICEIAWHSQSASGRQEAHRCLKPRGICHVVEVESRFTDVKAANFSLASASACAYSPLASVDKTAHKLMERFGACRLWWMSSNRSGFGRCKADTNLSE
eukprot:6481563-Amphidinium_carterae.3